MFPITLIKYPYTLELTRRTTLLCTRQSTNRRNNLQCDGTWSCTLDMRHIHVDKMLVCTSLKFKFISNKMTSLVEPVYSKLSKSLYSY